MIRKYVKKPIPVEAVLLTDSNVSFVIDWIRQHGWECYYDERLNKLYIQTLEGFMTAIPDAYYVVKGVNNEFYPVYKSIFNKTYEEINNGRD